MPYQVDDVVELKKIHPCGSRQWRILRTGTDYLLQCVGCGHRVLLARPKLVKAVKKRLEVIADEEV